VAGWLAALLGASEASLDYLLADVWNQILHGAQHVHYVHIFTLLEDYSHSLHDLPLEKLSRPNPFILSAGAREMVFWLAASHRSEGEKQESL
jgi:hypothetical protein